MGTSMIQKIRAGFVSLFLLTAINIFTGANAAPAQAFHGIGDVLADVPIVDVNEVTDVGSAAGCGVASATMVLDYWMPQSGNVAAALDPKAVLKYIPTHWTYTDNQGKTHYEAGTTFDQLQQGIEKLSADATFGYGLPLTAKWLTTSSSKWYTALQAEMSANPPHPVIIFVPNGRDLGWNWDYGHFIVVSGITSDGNIIYHDPWDGQKHTVSQQAFQVAWGTMWNQNDPWWYLQVQQKGQKGSSTPIVSIPTNPPTPSGTITEFTIPTINSAPWDITLGPDGNLWFTESQGIGKITPSGKITEYPLSLTSRPRAITNGPDGNLYFLADDIIGKITPSGNITKIPISQSNQFVFSSGLTTGPDGNLWFLIGTSQPNIEVVKMTLSGAITTFETTGTTASYFGRTITNGPNGNLWFTGDDSVGQITPTGQINQYPLPPFSGPWSITKGSDGNLWFTTAGCHACQIVNVGRITPQGIITEYPLPTEYAGISIITSGPDKNLWFTESNANKIGRITPNGVITEYTIPTSSSSPNGIIAGPDGALWFTEFNANKIGRITP